VIDQRELLQHGLVLLRCHKSQEQLFSQTECPHCTMRVYISGSFEEIHDRIPLGLRTHAMGNSAF